jgi:hypothetical protein
MAKVKNSSSISSSELKTTTKTRTFERLSNGVLHDRKEIERAIVSLISSARSSVEDDDMGNEDPLLFASSQINADFTLAAQCEAAGELSIDDMDQGFFDLFRSPTYWKQREAFVEAAVAGDEYAFMTAVWRGYNAGRVSPDRFGPKMRKKRAADARGASKQDKGAADVK